MRRGPSGIVRVLGVCARCGVRPDLYDVERVTLPLPTATGYRQHQLVVCRYCQTEHRDSPTSMEARAMAFDATDPIHVQAFAQRWTADLARVQRTASYFLGPERYAAFAEEARAARLQEEANEERWRAPARARQLAALLDPAADDEGDDDEERDPFAEDADEACW